MLVEIIKIVGDIVILAPIIVAIWIVLMMVGSIIKEKLTPCKVIKGLVCLSITGLVLISSIIFAMIGIVSVAKIWEQHEIEMATVVFPLVKEISYLATISFVLFVSAMSIIYLWKLVYLNQVIPGSGSVKKRIKDYFKGMKK